MRIWYYLEKEQMEKWNNLYQALRIRSKDCCEINECKEEEHKCYDIQAYITANGDLLDVCSADYFQGSTKPYAVIMFPIPREYSGEQLYKEVIEQEGIDFLPDDMVEHIENRAKELKAEGWKISINHVIQYYGVNEPDGDSVRFVQGEQASIDFMDVPSNVQEEAYLLYNASQE